jgi:hypothetical protein
MLGRLVSTRHMFWWSKEFALGFVTGISILLVTFLPLVSMEMDGSCSFWSTIQDLILEYRTRPNQNQIILIYEEQKLEKLDLVYSMPHFI